MFFSFSIRSGACYIVQSGAAVLVMCASPTLMTGQFDLQAASFSFAISVGWLVTLTVGRLFCRDSLDNNVLNNAAFTILVLAVSQQLFLLKLTTRKPNEGLADFTS